MKSTEQETLLVTGSTGNVGSHLVQQLSSSGQPITIKAAFHSVQSKYSLKDDKVETVQLDYKKPQTLKKALKDVDKVFLVTPESPNATELVSKFIIEARKADIRHIIKLSAQGADKDAVVASLRMHRHAEIIIEESGIPYTFLRPGEFMQNFLNFFSQTIREQNAFYLPAGNPRISFVDARDIAAVGLRVLADNGNGRHNGKAYNITGPEALSYYEVAKILSEATGKRIDYVNISKEEAQRAMKKSGINNWWINTVIEVYEFYKSGVQAQVSPAVEEITGNKPISFYHFAKEYAEAFK